MSEQVEMIAQTGESFVDETESDALWRVLGDYSYDYKPIRPDFKARAFSNLRGYLKISGEQVRQTILRNERHHRSEQQKQLCNQKFQQNKILNSQILEKIWDIAEEWVKEDRESAIQFLRERPETKYGERTIHYLDEVGIKAAGRNAEAYFLKSMKENRCRETNEEWLLSKINLAGGKHVVLTYAISQALMITVFLSWNILQGDAAIEPSDFNSSQMMRYQSKLLSLWIEPFRSQLRLLYSLPTELFPQYKGQIDYHQLVIDETVMDYDEMFVEIEDKNRELKVLVSDLRKKNKELEKIIEQARRKEQTSISVNVNNSADACAGTSHIETNNILSTRDREEIRQIRKEFERSQEQVAIQSVELENLRLFVQRLLAPENESQVRQNNVEFSDKEVIDSVIVFVGGHERLHTKLRKVLARARFIHPDQSKFSVDILKGATAVVFCSHYCNHSIFEKAVEEVRKLGIPAGYSNHNNVDQIINDIRTFLKVAGVKKN